MILVSRGPISERVLNENKEANDFAKKYGIHGLVLDMSNQAILEVRQLDWSLRIYADTCEGIPDAERHAYRSLIVKNPQVFRAYNAGGQYNVPLGDWVHIGEAGYDELRKLNIIAVI